VREPFDINLTPYDGPPYTYSVTVKGETKRMIGFDEQHIQDQLHPRKATRIIKLKDDTKRV